MASRPSFQKAQQRCRSDFAEAGAVHREGCAMIGDISRAKHLYLVCDLHRHAKIYRWTLRCRQQSVKAQSGPGCFVPVLWKAM